MERLIRIISGCNRIQQGGDSTGYGYQKGPLHSVQPPCLSLWMVQNVNSGSQSELEDFIGVSYRAGHRSENLRDSIPARQGDAGLSLSPMLLTPEGQDLMERLIRIIMDATGFNRDEIQPDMDLRRDLSIRSSRLPIIMDAAERQFGITIELEDFIDVRTVKDIAQRISAIIARQGGAGLQPATKAVDPDPARDEILKSSEDEASLKRLVFNLASVELAASIPMELSPGESVLLLSPDKDDAVAGRVGEILRRDYGVDTITIAVHARELRIRA